MRPNVRPVRTSVRGDKFYDDYGFTGSEAKQLLIGTTTITIVFGERQRRRRSEMTVLFVTVTTTLYNIIIIISDVHQSQ